MNRMTLSEYIRKSKRELNRFKKVCKENNKKYPRGCPLIMKEVDWYDLEKQFRLK